MSHLFSSMTNQFSLLDNPGKNAPYSEHPLQILIPGWATTAEVFNDLERSHQHHFSKLGPSLQTCPVHPAVFVEELEEVLTILYDKHLPSNGPIPIVITGFSMGARLVLDWLMRHASSPQLNRFKILEVQLIGARPAYTEADIQDLKLGMMADKKRLKQFYRACYADPRAFKHAFLSYIKGWIERFTTEQLLDGLDYLLQHPFPSYDHLMHTCQKLGVSLSFYHGKHDVIAPYSDLSTYLNNANLNMESAHQYASVVVNDCGHIG